MFFSRKKLKFEAKVFKVIHDQRQLPIDSLENASIVLIAPDKDLGDLSQ